MTRAWALAVAALAAAALGGCGSDDGGSKDGRSGDYLPGNSRLSGGGGLSQASTATCEQWRDASLRQRMAAVEDIAAVFARKVRQDETGETLPPKQAYETIDRACAQDFAANFRLWKLYTRAIVLNRIPARQ